MRFSIALICAAALAAIVPQAAVACPPAVCQYVEQTPGANGHNSIHGSPPNGRNSLSKKTQKQLNSSAAGRATARAANSTAPKSQGGKNDNAKNKKHKGAANQAATKRRNLPSQVSGSPGTGGGSDSGDGGGIGIVLPVILGLSLLAALGYAMWRRGVFRNFDLGSVFNRRGDVGG